jgi:hypothetical protein
VAELYGKESWWSIIVLLRICPQTTLSSRDVPMVLMKQPVTMDANGELD